MANKIVFQQSSFGDVWNGWDDVGEGREEEGAPYRLRGNLIHWATETLSKHDITLGRTDGWTDGRKDGGAAGAKAEHNVK